MSKTNCETILQADWLLPQDHLHGRPPRSIHKGAVAINQGRILAADTAHAVHAAYMANNTIDLGPALLMPGLVNAHTHSAMTLLRGVADDMPLLQWLTTRIWPLEGRLTKELIQLGSLLACAEMIRTGTTCFLDMYIHQRQTARAVEQSGMRAMLTEGLLAFPTLSYQNSEEAFALLDALLADFANHPRLSIALAAHTPHTATEEQIRRSHAMAQEHKTLWFTHCAESALETSECLDKLGKRPLAHLRDLGVLTPETALVHMVDVHDAERALVAEKGCKVIMCPRSNMKLASGIAGGQSFLQAGIAPALGTDGAASNNALNMFQEMAACALTGKVRELDATALPAGSVLDMATCNAADIFGISGLGTMKPGAPADIIALDVKAPNMQPLHDPVSQVVYAASGHEVRLTMVAGNILFKDGQYTQIDYSGLLDEMTAITTWARKNLD